ncbi:unnamed protein product [Discula destructiva]
MKAFANIFDEPDWNIRTEYLVHGKVHGPAFQGVCADQIQGVAILKGSCWWQPYKGPHTDQVYRHDLTEDEVQKAKQVAELFGSEGDEQPTVTIAVMAAELARLQWDTGMPEPYPKPIGLELSWESHDVDLFTENVSKELDLVAKMPTADWRRTLVNPRQYTGAMPNVGMMVNLLKDVEGRISQPRSPTASEKKKNNENKVSKPRRKPSIAKKILNKIKGKT